MEENEEAARSIIDIDKTQSTAAAMSFCSVNTSNMTNISNTYLDEVLLIINNLNPVRIYVSVGLT